MVKLGLVLTGVVSLVVGSVSLVWLIDTLVELLTPPHLPPQPGEDGIGLAIVFALLVCGYGVACFCEAYRLYKNDRF